MDVECGRMEFLFKFNIYRTEIQFDLNFYNLLFDHASTSRQRDVYKNVYFQVKAFNEDRHVVRNRREADKDTDRSVV